MLSDSEARVLWHLEIKSIIESTRSYFGTVIRLDPNDMSKPIFICNESHDQNSKYQHIAKKAGVQACRIATDTKMTFVRKLGTGEPRMMIVLARPFFESGKVTLAVSLIFMVIGFDTCAFRSQEIERYLDLLQPIWSAKGLI
jgi:hypothetical protein